MPCRNFVALPKAFRPHLQPLDLSVLFDTLHSFARDPEDDGRLARADGLASRPRGRSLHFRSFPRPFPEDARGPDREGFRVGLSRRVLGSGAGGNLFITADSFLFFIKKVVFVFFLLCRLGRTELIKARVMSVAGRDGGGIYFLAILASGCLRGTN